MEYSIPSIFKYFRVPNKRGGTSYFFEKIWPPEAYTFFNKKSVYKKPRLERLKIKKNENMNNLAVLTVAGDEDQEFFNLISYGVGGKFAPPPT